MALMLQRACDEAPSYLKESLRRLGAIVERPELIEVAVNPDGRVWVETQGDWFMRPTEMVLSVKDAGDLGGRIAAVAGTPISAERPVVSVSVSYEGRPIRAQVVRDPVVTGGWSITLRFFPALDVEAVRLDWLHGAQRPMEEERRHAARELADLAAVGRVEDAARFCVERKLNVVVSGGTSTGKTVVARKLLAMVGREERIVTIEEAAELLPAQPNVVTLLSDRERAHRSPDALLTTALRMRPDRIVLGEVRGAEALTFLEAINTGHGGSMTTLHAETPQLAVRRLAIAALKTEVPLSYADMIEYISGSIDVIVQTGRSESRRGLTEFHLPARAAGHGTEATE